MRRNEREGEKGTGGNTKRRRKGERWMKEIWKRRERIEKERGGRCYFLEQFF
jgi:hypothetical protein